MMCVMRRKRNRHESDFYGNTGFCGGNIGSTDRGRDMKVVLVVTQPDKPKGRGGKMQYTPVKEAALAHNIRYFSR